MPVRSRSALGHHVSWRVEMNINVILRVCLLIALVTLCSAGHVGCVTETLSACSVVRCTGLPFSSLYLKVRYRNSGRFHFAIIAENIRSLSLSEVRPVYMRDCGVEPANKVLSRVSSLISFFSWDISSSKYCTRALSSQPFKGWIGVCVSLFLGSRISSVDLFRFCPCIGVSTGVH
jgi:hypothetical protein